MRLRCCLSARSFKPICVKCNNWDFLVVKIPEIWSARESETPLSVLLFVTNNSADRSLAARRFCTKSHERPALQVAYKRQ
eukprot:2837099-Amphidinium_carterae.1